MSGVKIFVSHRIDIDSELIKNPLYVPVRCGAVFDHENPMNIAGDDTGDHISNRRMSFCEFTVQYWAWKNVDADYYGLCHYRRYLSFSARHFKTDEHNMIYVPALTPRAKDKYGFTNDSAMERMILNHDLITAEPAPVAHIPTAHGKQTTVRELWDAYVGIFFKQSIVDFVLQLIDRFAPQYSGSAEAYFSGTLHRGFNCYVMRKELFYRLCSFQFPIMFEAEQLLDTSGYTQTMMRTPAFIGEMLYGIFIYHLLLQESWHTKELQLVYFRNTDRITGQLELAKRYICSYAEQGARMIIDPFFAKGSQRREALKSVYYSVTHAKHRGAANISEGDGGNGSGKNGAV